MGLMKWTSCWWSPSMKRDVASILTRGLTSQNNDFNPGHLRLVLHHRTAVLLPMQLQAALRQRHQTPLLAWQHPLQVGTGVPEAPPRPKNGGA
jgi:hypothetical protein